MSLQADPADIAKRIVQVLLPLPLPEAFDYEEPEGMALAVGDLVAAPLGSRIMRGVVVAVSAAGRADRPLKAIAGRLPDPPLPANTLEFITWAARYAVDAPGSALAIVLRGLNGQPPRAERRLIASGRLPDRSTPSRDRVLAAAKAPIPRAELAQTACVSDSVIRNLIDTGSLMLVETRPSSPFAPPDVETVRPPLSESQAAAASALSEGARQPGFSATLLDGVTGSGKTEVYLEAAASILAEHPEAQVLVLLPEIALTQAVLERFTARFAAAPAEWHSGVSSGLRRRTWEAVADGTARIVVGARSALFLPFRRLRLIVVDEEHDGSYKQEEGFIYQARDLAVVRAKIESCAVILASATPSLETLWNARQGRYGWVRLVDRHGGATMPRVELIDMRTAPPDPGKWLSPPLVAAMSDTLARGEQCLLFLNRRGYAPLVLCRACGERMKAPDSDSWLVEHRYSGRLVCHLTGFSMAKPDACPHCHAQGSLVSIGPGVERIEEEARSRFPDARLAVFSSDTVADAQAARRMVDAMANGEYDIMIATQSAAKGHNFPGLTLVGVVDGDLGLRGGDLRAAERTYQLLTQVSGRAGRRERAGRALIQTWAPDHAVMRALAAGDRDGFLSVELGERRAVGLPPFGRLAAVIISSPDAVALETFARAFVAAAPNAEGVNVYGPADAPLALVRGQRRKRILVQADRRVDLSAFLATWRGRSRPPSSIRVTIDMDPYSFL